MVFSRASLGLCLRPDFRDNDGPDPMSKPPELKTDPLRSSDPAGSPTVLVTGGSRGIGRAICLEFGRRGWRVGVHYRERQGEADRTAMMIKDDGGEAALYRADIRQADQVQAMVQGFVSCWGRLNVMVCNAGQAVSGLLLRLRPEQWADAIETNLTGTFHCLRAAGPVMLSQRDGSVVVVTSFSGLQGRTGQAAYAASKAGLLGLVKAAAREWGPHNVRINAVCPGWHPTDMSDTSLPEEAERTDHVLGRFGDMESVARSVYHLALSRDTSGQVWNLDSRIL